MSTAHRHTARRQTARRQQTGGGALTNVWVGVQVAAQLLLATLQGALYLDGVVQVPLLLKLPPDASLLRGGAGG